MRTRLSLPIVALLLAAAWPAAAAPTTATYTLTASGFADLLGSTTPPSDPVRLDFSLTFDPAAGDQFDDATGIALLASSIAIGGPLAYDYDSGSDTLTVGGAGLSTAITAGTNDVLAVISDISSAGRSFGGLEYATRTSSGIYLAANGTVAVPEPMSALVLLGGLAGVAALRRRA